MDDSALPTPYALLRDRTVRIALLSALIFRVALGLIPQLRHYTRDSSSYLAPGVNFFLHGVYAQVCEPRCIPTLFRTPGYPIFVGLVVGAGKLPLVVVYVLQSVGDTITTLLVAGIGWAVGSRRVGVVSAFVYALNPFAAVFAGQIMTESMATFVLMSIVYALVLMRPLRSIAPVFRWIGLGAMFGLLTLVRPTFALVPAIFALTLFEPSHWRQQVRGWALAAAGCALVVAPWVGRNWVVTRDSAADDRFSPLGTFFSSTYRDLLKPGLVRWHQSFEEPFIWDRPSEPPVVATYFLPGERERVGNMFGELRASSMVVTPELDAKFEQLASERMAAHPFRTRFLPPVSRALRLWITPRLSSFGIESARLSSFGGRVLFLVATVYNAVLALIAFATGFGLIRSATIRLLLVAPLYLSVLHPFVMWGNQSRYVVPSFPQISILAVLGAFLLVERIHKRRSTVARASAAGRLETP